MMTFSEAIAALPRVVSFLEGERLVHSDNPEALDEVDVALEAAKVIAADYKVALDMGIWRPE